MLMILARLVRSESFWAVVKVRSPHTVPEVCYIIEQLAAKAAARKAKKTRQRESRVPKLRGRCAGSEP